MKIVVAEDYNQMSRMAANLISAQVIMKPNCVLGLATGSTPIGMYNQLIEWYKKGDIDFSQVTSINLDEYRGLAPDNDQSYRYFMDTHFFNHINIDKKRTHVPDGLEPDANKVCRDYNKIITDCGGIDLQLLGIGINGHIGFNEPGTAFEKETHVVDLAESTIRANSRFFASLDEVPKQAYTMGIKTIMQAKKILVVANGKEKAQAIKDAFFGPILPKVPGSVLQLHNDVTLIGDKEALSLILDEIE
ncbi:MAG: glucosamine-6-phosphate deaminase [Acetatifactor sp.]|nr:glucosamine-6-phosphate deaminase [Acetatifactor sp.]